MPKLVLAISMSLIAPLVFAVSALQLDVAKSDFKPQHSAIINAINTDPNFSETSQNDRSQISDALDRISDALNDVGSFKELAPAVQEKVLADQALVNSSLNKGASDSRLICKNEASLGSNMRRRVCQTQASRNRQNDQVRQAGTVKTSN